MLATIVVNTMKDDLTPNDGSVSLRKAIQAINAGSDGGDANLRAARTGAYGSNDTIILPAGTFKITIAPSGEDDNTTGDFNVGKAVTIQGAGDGATIIDGNGLDRVFNFQLATTPVSYTATINSVTIQGGFLTSGRGAGIQVNDSSANPITLKVNNSTIQNNNNSTNGNNDGDGGGINSENGPITLTNCTVANNSAGDDGGGVNEKGAGTVTVINSIIKDNLAFSPGNASDGGGLDNEGGGNIVVMDSTITGNRAGGEGGGIDSHKHDGDITITNSIVSFNSNVSPFGEGIVGGGGGIAQDDNGKLTITNCLVTGNTTRQSGGGIIDTGTGDVTITGSEITGNIAETDGGGLLNTGATTLSISSSTFSSNNTSIGNGGGLDLQTTAAGSTLANVTISDNTVGGNGGGIFKTGASIITLLNNTVVFNTIAMLTVAGRLCQVLSSSSEGKLMSGWSPQIGRSLMNNLRQFIERVLIQRQARKQKLQAVQQDLHDLRQHLEHLHQLATGTVDSDDASPDLRQRAASLASGISALERHVSDGIASTAKAMRSRAA